MCEVEGSEAKAKGEGRDKAVGRILVHSGRRRTRRESFLMGLRALKVEKWRNSVLFSMTVASSRSQMKVWLIQATTTVLLWACMVQITALGETWGPRTWMGLPSCLSRESTIDTLEEKGFNAPVRISPPKSESSFVIGFCRNNGYLMLSCNGGLNQMRAAICDMVAIARFLNVTLIVPELDKTSFWADPSDFHGIFDVDHFISSLRDEFRILKELPPRLKKRVELGLSHAMAPVSWSDVSYYHNQILPLIQRHKVVLLNRTDARLANNGQSLELQRLRCRVNFSALKFTSQIEELGRRVIQLLRRNGPFLVLHLRYEMDMLAFSGCTQGCSDDEVEELTRMRYAYPWWKEKVINSELKRKDGLCPLTPEETALTLQALGIGHNIQIYIAAGEMYGGERRKSSLAAAYPRLCAIIQQVRRETLLQPSDLRFFQNHSPQMAGLDYIVSLESDIFVPTYDGNKAKVVEGHRRFLGFKKTIALDRRLLVELIDRYSTGLLSWEEFLLVVKEAHANRMGNPSSRLVISERPKEEDYFYANPHECLEPSDESLSSV